MRPDYAAAELRSRHSVRKNLSVCQIWHFWHRFDAVLHRFGVVWHLFTGLAAPRFSAAKPHAWHDLARFGPLFRSGSTIPAQARQILAQRRKAREEVDRKIVDRNIQTLLIAFPSSFHSSKFRCPSRTANIAHFLFCVNKCIELFVRIAAKALPGNDLRRLSVVRPFLPRVGGRGLPRRRKLLPHKGFGVGGEISAARAGQIAGKKIFLPPGGPCWRQA